MIGMSYPLARMTRRVTRWCRIYCGTTVTDGVEVADVIEALDARQLLDEIHHGADEVGTEAVVDELVEKRDLTFEDARRVLYGLIDARKLALTPRYTVRVP